jgi:ribulose-phosphate 3-epimerase
LPKNGVYRLKGSCVPHPDDLSLQIGVKSDPIECRYSFPWLFGLMEECGVRHLQLGTFFELYDLPDAFFTDLRRQAADHGVGIRSVFTSHRELGGFFRDEPGWVTVARRSYERLIEIGALVGADSVGSNPGSILRDRMALKPWGLRTYLDHMKELMAYAFDCGVPMLTMEPMSCLAEPPTLPDEMRMMVGELAAHHVENPETADIGLCVDVSHGYADETGDVVHGHMELLEAALPFTVEMHLKNTDFRYGSTFGFSDAERQRGVVDLAAVRSLLERNASHLPVRRLVAYLEMGGPKLGRDYSDKELGEQLRTSLAHCRAVFERGSEASNMGAETPAPVASLGPVQLSPSIMCADALRLEQSVRDLEAVGVHMLHFDIMDARFAPNMPLGLETLRAVRQITNLPFDVHLMVMDNDFFVEQVARLGAAYVSVHVESATHLDRTLARIRDLGMKAGAALNPATPLSALRHVVERLDFVLLMTVNPGFAGQALVASAIRKIGECRQWLREQGCSIPIEVDGNVSFANVPDMVGLGADTLVCGTSSLFAPEGSLRRNARRLRAAVVEGLQRREA